MISAASSVKQLSSESLFTDKPLLTSFYHMIAYYCNSSRDHLLHRENPFLPLPSRRELLCSAPWQTAATDGDVSSRYWCSQGTLMVSSWMELELLRKAWGKSCQLQAADKAGNKEMCPQIPGDPLSRTCRQFWVRKMKFSACLSQFQLGQEGIPPKWGLPNSIWWLQRSCPPFSTRINARQCRINMQCFTCIVSHQEEKGGAEPDLLQCLVLLSQSCLHCIWDRWWGSAGQSYAASWTARTYSRNQEHLLFPTSQLTGSWLTDWVRMSPPMCFNLPMPPPKLSGEIERPNSIPFPLLSVYVDYYLELIITACVYVVFANLENSSKRSCSVLASSKHLTCNLPWNSSCSPWLCWHPGRDVWSYMT